jgi:hypothetical protein
MVVWWDVDITGGVEYEQEVNGGSGCTFTGESMLQALLELITKAVNDTRVVGVYWSR